MISKKILTMLTLYLITLATASAKEQLIFAADLIRHGDRTPIHEIPKSPYVWKEGLGELTAEGMRQEFDLGVKLHKKYIEQAHLLSKHYLAETMYVRSTDTNRTLVSAESLLLGLYPLGTGPYLSASEKPSLPQAFQPIPVHTDTKEHDTLLQAKPSQNFFLLASHFVSTREEWKKKIAPFKEKINAWDQITGMQLEDPRQMGTLGDDLFIRKLHHVPLPKGMSEEDAYNIITLGSWHIVNNFKYKEITSPMGYEFLNTIVNYMQQAIQKTTPLKYALFSGHDSSIMSVLTTLGVTFDETPGYASDLNFSLFQDDKKYYVKISFNDKPITVPACGGDVCSFEQLRKLSRSRA